MDFIWTILIALLAAIFGFCLQGFFASKALADKDEEIWRLRAVHRAGRKKKREG